MLNVWVGPLGGEARPVTDDRDRGIRSYFWAKNGRDLLYIQGHSSPGIYARSFLEGRLTEQQLDEALDLESMTHP